MRSVGVFLALASALVLLACFAAGALVSINDGRTGWLLIGVFLIDSAALVLLLARTTIWRGNGKAGSGGAASG